MVSLGAGFLHALGRAAGPGGLLLGGEDLERYAADETEDLRFLPEVVVRPRRREAVAEILGLCSREGVPVTPRGAGTGLSGGALPVRGGVVLVLDRLDRIVAVDEGNMTATVEPGVITQVLQEEVEARGLFYPPDPASRGSCTIGGNIAESAGGPRAVKYGVTGEYVMGLEAVLMDGTVIRTGGACRKDVAGYDLTRLLVGSEGTLAVVTLATLRLVPLPAERRLFLAGFPTLEAGIHGVLEVLRRLTPSTCEYLERAAVEAAARHLGVPVPMEGAGSYLLVEVDGGSAAHVDAQLEAAGEAVEAAGAAGVQVAMTPREEEALWRLRRATGEAVKGISPYRELDCVVPRPRIAELVAGVKEIAGRHGVDTICYGHAGDGNIHVNVLRGDASRESWERALGPLATAVFELALSLGGTITGEHGVGWINREAMRLRHGKAELELMHALKAAFDPRGLLNPEKVIPEPKAPAPGAPRSRSHR